MMTGPPSPVSIAEAKPYFEQMLATGEFSDSLHEPILLNLFDRLKARRGARTPQKELYDALSKTFSFSEDSLRPSIRSLRDKLLRYNLAHRPPIEFTIPVKRYVLVVTRSESKSEPGRVRLLLRRGAPGDLFEKIVCDPSDSVLFVGLAAKPVFDEYLKPWFKKARIRTKHFRVLTWRPAKGLVDVVAAHLGQNAEDLAKNIESAWKEWQELQASHPHVEVYGYAAVPTVLGVCNDQYLKAEFVPVNGPGGTRASSVRPSIIIERGVNPDAYNYFRAWFDDLWFSAMGRARQQDVHPRWRVVRNQLLRQRRQLRLT